MATADSGRSGGDEDLSRAGATWALLDLSFARTLVSRITSPGVWCQAKVTCTTAERSTSTIALTEAKHNRRVDTK